MYFLANVISVKLLGSPLYVVFGTATVSVFSQSKCYLVQTSKVVYLSLNEILGIPHTKEGLLDTHI